MRNQTKTKFEFRNQNGRKQFDLPFLPFFKFKGTKSTAYSTIETFKHLILIPQITLSISINNLMKINN